MCQIRGPDRSKAAAAPWHQIQPAVKLRAYFQQSHEHTQHIRYACMHIHVPAPQNSTADAQHLHKHKEHQWPHPVPLTG